MKLPYDICRCTNKECQFSKSCARHQCREIGQRTPSTRFPSLPKMDWSCPEFIQYTEDK